MKLTPTQVESFYQDGYLVVGGALSDEELNPLISDFEVLITTLADELYAEGTISERYENSQPAVGAERRSNCPGADRVGPATALFG